MGCGNVAKRNKNLRAICGEVGTSPTIETGSVVESYILRRNTSNNGKSKVYQSIALNYEQENKSSNQIVICPKVLFFR